MKVVMKSRSDKAIERHDYRGALVIEVDDKEVARFYDGETEDSVICRNFSDVFSIDNLMEMAYKAGKAGDSFEVSSIVSDDI